MKLTTKLKDDLSSEHFFDAFYRSSAEVLFRPILHEIPEYKDVHGMFVGYSYLFISGMMLIGVNYELPRAKTNLYLYLCDLLCTFATQHSFRSHFFLLSSNIAAHMATLLSVQDKHLCLGKIFCISHITIYKF